VISEIAALKKMTVGELRDEWHRLYGDPTRSRNRDYLWRRLAWRVQELAHGGLSGATNARLQELAPDAFARAGTPRGAAGTALAASMQTVGSEPRRVRDPRLPAPGTVIIKNYKGHELRLVVHDDHFELDGQSFNSVSEAARHVTGARWNGMLFFGLTQRKRKA